MKQQYFKVMTSLIALTFIAFSKSMISSFQLAFSFALRIDFQFVEVPFIHFDFLVILKV